MRQFVDGEEITLGKYRVSLTRKMNLDEVEQLGNWLIRNQHVYLTKRSNGLAINNALVLAWASVQTRYTTLALWNPDLDVHFDDESEAIWFKLRFA